MKNLLFTFILLFSFNTFAQDEFIQKVQESKKNVRSQIEKSGMNYDGTQTTYFQYGSTPQHKGVEIAIFLREKYKFFFDATLASSEVSVEIYDKAPGYSNRKLLFESKNIARKKIEVSIEDLQNKFTAQGGNPKLLSTLYIEYIIKKAETSRGAITLGLGF